MGQIGNTDQTPYFDVPADSAVNVGVKLFTYAHEVMRRNNDEQSC